MKTEKKPEKFDLWWISPLNEKRQYAGVAFFDETYGEYRLRLDYEPETQLYLRPIGLINDKQLFKVEIVRKRNGKFFKRFPVGEGVLGKDTDGEVHMELGPYIKTLALPFKEKSMHLSIVSNSEEKAA